MTDRRSVTISETLGCLLFYVFTRLLYVLPLYSGKGYVVVPTGARRRVVDGTPDR